MMENLTKKIEYRYLKDKELYNLYVDFNLDDPWEKFNEIEKLKYFKVNDLFPYNSKDDSHYHIYFCAFLNDKIIGMLKLKVGGESSFRYDNWKNWVCFISILPEFQGNHISRKLIQMMYQYAKEKNLNILMSGYSEDGFNKVKKIFNEESKNYNVSLLDDRNEIEF